MFLYNHVISMLFMCTTYILIVILNTYKKRLITIAFRAKITINGIYPHITRKNLPPMAFLVLKKFDFQQKNAIFACKTVVKNSPQMDLWLG